MGRGEWLRGPPRHSPAATGGNSLHPSQPHTGIHPKATAVFLFELEALGNQIEGKRAFFIHYAINGDVTAKINFSEICRELTKCFLEQSILFIGIVSHEGAHFSGVRAKPPGKEVLLLDVHLNRTDPVASIEIASHPNLDTRRTLLQGKTTFIAIRLCVSR